MSNEVLVHPDEIKVDERMRQDYRKIPELAESLKKLGLIQNIVVDAEMNLIAGGRRLAAAKLAKLDLVPITVKSDVSPLEKLEMEIEENLQRDDLTYAEEVLGKKRIHEIKTALHGNQSETGNRGDWSKRDTARALGESPSSLVQDIALAEAIEKCPELAKCKNKSEAHKLLNKMAERAIMSELAKREEISGSKHYKYAEHHYRVGDALAGLKELDPTVASFAEVDPPYAIDIHQCKKTADSGSENLSKYEEIASSDYIPFIRGIATELYRVLADNAWIIWWFGIEWYQQTFQVLSAVGFEVDKIPAIWAKPAGQTNQPDRYLARSYETFFVARKGTPVMKERGKSNVLSFSKVPHQKKIHATEKPIELMEHILDIFTYPGAVAIVPFLGSGVTLRALYKQGKTGFGWDLSEDNKKLFLLQVAKDVEGGVYK